MRRRRKVERDRRVLLAQLLSDESRVSVKGWLKRLGVPDRDQDDVTQAVLLGAHQSFDTFDPGKGGLERWLNRITVYQAAHYRQLARHWREELTDELDALAEDYDLEELLDAVKLRARLYVAAAGLPPDERHVFEGLYFDGSTVRSLAESAGSTEQTAHRRRWRAVARVGEEIQGKGKQRWTP